jgi:uroporphyrin-III C-methyltransferase
VWRRAEYDHSQLDGFRLVVAATADRRLNRAIGREAERRGILSCVVSSARCCRVIFPAVWSGGDITVAVHSQGRNCRQSQAVRNRIAAWLSEPRRTTTAGTGRVYIIGAGPGAADLISVRGYRALRSANAILVDRLVPATFLEDLGISPAGKCIRRLEAENRHGSQEEINRWLLSAETKGRTVVRLKGGDPFIFGRGDSEIECLSSHGIPWEVIPGPSSATAVLTAAGLPLTRHGQGRSFAVTTARVEGGRVTTSFPRADSLVILMGVTVLDQVAARLSSDGWPSDTPTAIVERGTLTWERHVSGPLCRLGELARRAGVASPALVVVGEAARIMAAVRRRPTILFTGLNPARFRTLGNILHWPALAIAREPEGEKLLPRALVLHPELGRPLPGYDVIYFASPAGVRAYAERYGPEAFQGDVWCLGKATQKALAECGVAARVVRPPRWSFSCKVAENA